MVRLDNLAFFFGSVFDFARWPVDVFRRGTVWRILFTFVIPLGLMTTYPAEALLDAPSLPTVAFSVLGTVAFASVARFVWKRAISRYTSASS